MRATGAEKRQVGRTAPAGGEGGVPGGAVAPAPPGSPPTTPPVTSPPARRGAAAAAVRSVPGYRYWWVPTYPLPPPDNNNNININHPRPYFLLSSFPLAINDFHFPAEPCAYRAGEEEEEEGEEEGEEEEEVGYNLEAAHLDGAGSTGGIGSAAASDIPEVFFVAPKNTPGIPQALALGPPCPERGLRAGQPPPRDATGPSPGGKFPPSQSGLPRAPPPPLTAAARIRHPQTKKGGCRWPLAPGCPPSPRMSAALTPLRGLRATRGPGSPVGAVAAGRGGDARALPAPAGHLRARPWPWQGDTRGNLGFFFNPIPPWEQR